MPGACSDSSHGRLSVRLLLSMQAGWAFSVIGILENACLKRVVQTTQSTYNVGEVMERAEDGILHVTVGPQTASVYIAARNVEEN